MAAKLTTLEQLNDAIKAVAEESASNIPSHEAAKEFILNHNALVEPFLQEWAIEKVASLIRWQRNKLARVRRPQYAFEAVLGFRRLPEKIVLASGAKVRREEATLRQWIEFRRRLYREGHPLLPQADKAIELLSKYTPEQRAIRFGAALKLEAEKAAAKSTGGKKAK